MNAFPPSKCNLEGLVKTSFVTTSLSLEKDSGSCDDKCHERPVFQQVEHKLSSKDSLISGQLVADSVVHCNERNHICPLCNKGFKKKAQLNRHSNCHSSIPRFFCYVCGKRFKHNDVAKHVRRFHEGSERLFQVQGGLPKPTKSSQQRDSNEDKDTVDSECETNQLQLQQERHQSNRIEKIEHNLNLHGNKSLTPGPFTDLKVCNMNTHSKLSSSSNDNTPSGLNSIYKFPCDKCNGSFLNKSGLVSHMTIHQKEEGKVTEDPKKVKHHCNTCGKTFTRHSCLNAHLKMHSQSRTPREPNPNLRCNECGKTFTRRAGLNAHILQHEGTIHFWCDEPACGKGFVRFSQLRRHKRCHSQVFPYTCHICGKSFRHNDLAKHMRIHSGTKPHKTQHCEKTFAFSSSHVTHECMHLASLKHEGEICNMKSDTVYGLSRHVISPGEIVKKPCSFREEKVSSKVQLSLQVREVYCNPKLSGHGTNKSAQFQAQPQMQVQQLHNTHQVDEEEIHLERTEPPISQHPHSISICFAKDSNFQSEETNLATLTTLHIEPYEFQLPVSSREAAVLSATTVGPLPLYEPVPVSVPFAEPFCVSLTSL